MSTSNGESLEVYIHRQIPITSHMGVRIVEATTDRVELAAPLAPNINHRETVFGGSAAAIATLAAWTLVLVRMRAESISARLVIAKNSMEYRMPITADFTAVATADQMNGWDRFLAGINRKGRGRLIAASELFLNDECVAAFEGHFVAIRNVNH